jgi:HSP20 family molecular chaperone IbpA
MKKGQENKKPALMNSAVPFRLSVDGDRIQIIAELTKISGEKIMLDLEGTTLVISATDGETRYKKKISLPWEARLGKKRFRKGVLELTLEKADL